MMQSRYHSRGLLVRTAFVLVVIPISLFDVAWHAFLRWPDCRIGRRGQFLQLHTIRPRHRQQRGAICCRCRTSPPDLEPPKDFAPPKPKPLTVTRPDLLPALLGGALALLIRFLPVFVVGWRPGLASDADKGKYALQLGPLKFRDESLATDGKLKRPTQPLVLYEYEGSPFCRKVREALSMLDVSCEMRPCPGARAGFSQELAQRTGRRTVPYLIDPNTGEEMFESDDIVDYLFETYGPGKSEVPFFLKEPISAFTGTYATIFRGLAGATPEPGVRPENCTRRALELWGYDASPFVKLVREKLCALTLPHVLVPCARGSANRDLMMTQTGVQFQVPFLRDANTGVELFEAAEICEYLEAVYTKSP
ncbi:unnamed protein product [Polarella glacialis]|uniref:GST N-terminal domain-containing protein n=1 Tax=Polarella glacialis TaxID=89957 RepID=A0A813KP15_POLGL|nr:unnamed protein product [Polarella glacialis]